MPTVDYLPVATGGSANVDSQANFAGSTYQVDGVQPGLAQSKQANKIWRQSSVIGAMIANFIANNTGSNVLDDGNVSELLINFGLAIAAYISGATLTQPTPSFGDNSTKVANTAFVQAAIAPLIANIATNASNISTLSGTVSSLNSQVSTLNSQVSTLNSQMSTAQSNITTLQADFAGLAITGTLSTPGHSANTTYTNSSGNLLFVSGSCSTAGSSTGNLNCVVNGTTVFSEDATATLSSGRKGFVMMVPNGATYRVNTSGAVGAVVDWAEVAIGL